MEALSVWNSAKWQCPFSSPLFLFWASGIVLFTVSNTTKLVTWAKIYSLWFNLSELFQQLQVSFRYFTKWPMFAIALTESRKYSISVIEKWRFFVNLFSEKVNSNFFFFPDENTSSVRIYVRTNNLCELILKWSITVITVSYFVSTIFAIAAGALFYYLKDGHVKTENLYLPLKLKCVTVQLKSNNILIDLAYTIRQYRKLLNAKR